MRYLFGFICVLALGLLQGLSCGESKECDENRVGMVECSEDLGYILLCSEDFIYEQVADCLTDGERCRQPEGEPACVCDEGWKRCSADNRAIDTCDQAGDWIETASCDPNQVCDNIGGVTQCVVDTCTEGESRCAGDNTKVETCGTENDWTPTATCDVDEICRVVSDDAQCVVEALAIIEVKWVWSDPCTYMTPSDVTITTTANFADLDYSGSVTDCTGDFDRSEVVLTCANQTLMAGSVTVTNPRNNDQATVSFAFDGCVNGRVCADGEPCCNEETLRCSESDPSIIEECAADGSWVLSETCEEGTLCNDDAVSAVCKAAECVDGDLRCFESDGWPGTDIEYCSNGTWVFSQSCQQRPNQSRPDWVCVINDNLDPPVYYCG